MANTVKEEHVSNVKRQDEKGTAATHGGNKEDSPRLPHERDESSYGKKSEKSQAVIQQAYDDIDQGQVDTDRRGMPGVEEVQRDKAGAARQEIPASSRMPPSTPKK